MMMSCHSWLSSGRPDRRVWKEAQPAIVISSLIFACNNPMRLTITPAPSPHPSLCCTNVRPQPGAGNRERPSHARSEHPSASPSPSLPIPEIAPAYPSYSLSNLPPAPGLAHP
ncbi:hypothetical protein CALVIDRAFT_278249 [Calocera viscosa TUFC12733]|uniref:Uncharacterized protein n=1 Tax=Calocera viscosa (strain TUFC12733) TaxID=1330018 RepID=A0A167R2W2_CALVF|nr:hypothetical protein CALVIDRAFT_278249 [Calocera viscosa TUFC12733]